MPRFHIVLLILGYKVKMQMFCIKDHLPSMFVSYV